ncbi:MAG: nucleoside triphosphate pyrophosphohydrolase [Halanaerobiales bacterium]
MNYKQLKEEILQLVQVMERLRGPNGCPWDKEQDYYSLKPYVLEEAYEVVEALQKKDLVGLKEELGDLLLQVVFQAQIARENQEFDLVDIIRGIRKKLIRRHPHVFGDMEIDNAEDVKVTWDKIKKEEKNKNKISILDDVKKDQPAAIQAYKLQEKAAGVGFDWEKTEDVIKKIEEELMEVKEAIREKDDSYVEEEIGDLIFAVINLARFYNVNPEMALLRTIEKFKKRFEYIEKSVEKNDTSFKQLSLMELDEFWEESKSKEKEE